MNKVHMKFWSKNDPEKTPRVGETCSSEREASFIKYQAYGNYICSIKLNTQDRQLISLFPRQSSLENVPTTSLNSEPRKLRISVRCMDNNYNNCMDLNFCAGCMDLYDHIDSINAIRLVDD
jgi:hypothetical protein